MHCNVNIDRSDLVASLKDIMHSDNEKFGLVIGPSGSGKSHAIRAACNIVHSSILYCEVNDPLNTAHELAKTAGFGFF